MGVYYNDNDLNCAAWLANLMEARLIRHGKIDQKSIAEVRAEDLEGIKAAHFFAGIAGWELALRLAGWPKDLQVWTGSCPCQPFSIAGKRKGAKDKRHLWPEFRRLIAERRPSTLFGEQVTSKDGRKWLARVRADLEALGYAVGGADLCAAGVGAPHIRQRLFYVAESARQQFDGPRSAGASGRDEFTDSRDAGGLADRQAGRRHQINPLDQGRVKRVAPQRSERSEYGGGIGRVGDSERPERRSLDYACGDERSDVLLQRQEGSGGAGGSGEDGFWSRFILIPCADGKYRRIPEPSSVDVADGVSVCLAPRGSVENRTGKLRAFGNAIVPEVAAQFIAAYMDIRGIRPVSSTSGSPSVSKRSKTP